ncbi:MAG: ion transporter [Gammaproteobacteria bacterium]|nr:ion transporter [Gammaproteobacteria bacterium]
MQNGITLWRDRLMRLRSNKLFESAVIAVIIASALLIGVKTYDIDPVWISVLEILDIGVTTLFLVEICVRMAAERRFLDFFKQGWNLFDFTIVVVSLIPMDNTEMALLARLLRIFRVLRLISVIPELRLLVNALIVSIPRMGYVALLMFIIFYIYAAIGCHLFEHINPVLWGNVSIALLTLFRVATFEDWTDVMYETMDSYGWSWIYYLTFIFFTAFVLLNMMIGIVLDVMQREHENMERDEGKGEAAEVHWLKEHTGAIEERLVRIEALLESHAGKCAESIRKPEGG